MYRKAVFSLELTPSSSRDGDALPGAASPLLPSKPLLQPANVFAQNSKESDLRESPTASRVITGTDGQPPCESVYLLHFLREASWLQ